MWQRWNGTTKIFEKSSDNGVVWTPLGLDASILTQGSITLAARIVNIALAGAVPNNYVCDFRNLTTASGQSFGVFVMAGTTADDSCLFLRSAAGSDLFRVDGQGSVIIGSGVAPAATGYGARLAAVSNRNYPTALAAVNQENSAFSSAGFIFSAAGNSWVNSEGSQVKNNNALTWDLDMTNPQTKMTLRVDGYLFVFGGYAMNTWPRTVSAANVQTGDGAPLYLSTSSLRFKTDIETIDLDVARAVIQKLRGITYRGKTENDNKRRFAGFGAEEVAELDPVLVTYDKDGLPDYVTYDRVPAYIVPVVQDHESRLAALEQRLEKR